MGALFLEVYMSQTCVALVRCRGGTTSQQQLMVRHSEIVNGNAHLKKEIDHLRKERTTANEVHAQFEASIHQIRGEISGLMAQASAINDHREELVKTKEVRRESRPEASWRPAAGRHAMS